MKKLWKNATFLLMLVLMVVGLTACGDNNEASKDNNSGGNEPETNSLDYYKSKGITLGFDQTFVPMGFLDEKGEYVGFDIDLAKELTSRMGVELKLQPIEWKMKETELNNEAIDLIWNGYSINDERKEKVTFSTPYLGNKQVVVVLSNSGIQTIADLADREVATQDGSSAVDALAAHPEVLATFKNADMTLYTDYADALRDLENERVEAVVGDQILIGYYIEKMGADKFSILAEDFGSEEYGIGMRKSDTALHAEVNRIMDEMKADGTAAEISIKWFGENIVK